MKMKWEQCQNALEYTYIKQVAVNDSVDRIEFEFLRNYIIHLSNTFY